MRNTFAIAFYARQSKVAKDGTCPLELSLSINGERRFYNLPYRTTPEDFKKKRQPKELQDYQNLMRARINQVLTDMLSHGEPITSDRILQYIRTGGYQSYTANDLFKAYLGLLKERVGTSLTQSVYRRYELVYEQFKAMFDCTKECPEVFTPSNIQQYNIYLYNKYDDSTAAGYMTKVKTYMKYALDNGKITINPCQGIKINHGSKPIIYLTAEEINKLAMTNLYGNASLERVRDCFLFGCFSGVSYCDMMDLTREDIQENNGVYYIHKRRRKTGTEYTAVLLPGAIDILKKYDYRLPMISNQKMNVYLKTIGELADIKTLLTVHKSRHTYCTLLLNSGVRLETVSKCVGHANTNITQKFYAHLEDKTIIEEVSAIFPLQ